MANTIHVDVVNAEESLFSGEATFVVLPGEAGELGIYPRHTPLITRIKPGAVRIQTPEGGEELRSFIEEMWRERLATLKDEAEREERSRRGAGPAAGGR